MSRAIENRLIRLEQFACYRTGGSLGCVVHCRDGESFEQAAKRQGFTGGGLLCIGEVMAPDDWSRAAKAQQAELTRDGAIDNKFPVPTNERNKQ